ncbi:helix-turn-helix domain-containing protein [Actinomadura kijaniata]|uniref:helix-turn-helix domain-containing protein n=1 Tax=Actinomadura kijaniata TaxID=46161 RepID=UPI001FE0AB43|nr:helix-turn-helix transcriptional regulator [Actinomadura kijaniata]
MADRLRDLRLQADLTGVQLAAAADWHKSKVSRIEKAVQPVTQADIRTWCRVCGADDMVEDLVASLRALESAYVEWRRLETTGLRRLQESYVPLFERTRWMRVYQPQVIPGLLQTEGYATALLSAITGFRGLRDDVRDAVRARLARRRVLTEGGRTFVFLLEETVLRYQVGDRRTMLDQLAHLMTSISLPSSSLGVIPQTAPRTTMWALEGFTIYDHDQAQLELLGSRITVTMPGELRVYERAFDELSAMAVFGDRARALIEAAADTFR